MLLRFNYSDAATAATMEACAHAINELAARGLNAMVEPFVSVWKGDRIVNDLSADSVIRSIAIASGLARTSAHTWLKLPCIPDMARVMEATTLPSLILGGEVSNDRCYPRPLGRGASSAQCTRPRDWPFTVVPAQ